MTRAPDWSCRFAAELPAEPPPAPAWGQRPVGEAPDLARRLVPDPDLAGRVAIVLGAGGAFGPDVVRALGYQGVGLVVGVDVCLTYPVVDAVYRRVDLADPAALAGFFESVWALAAQLGVRADLVVELATIQTTPTAAVDRQSLEAGKRALLEVLAGAPGDVAVFHMSTAEVYGAPPGAPYREDHVKAPFNDYGREKMREEEVMLAGHGRATAGGGRIRVVALRSWTIGMVETDGAGRVVETRNYNDPIMYVAERLARAGIRTPVVDVDLLGTFHLGEEVAEVAAVLLTEPAESPAWGRVLNATGRPAGHGPIRDVLFDAFSAAPPIGPPWWARPAGVALAHGRLPRRGLEALAWLAEHAGGAFGARDMAARLPFLYRSTHLDPSALQELVGHRLSDPQGGDTLAAVRRIAVGLRDGGPDALNQRRYDLY
ncbi:MAG: NAD-dependent epimerase/dehydratase family protein [Candidatus Nanopelagicales bacterium]|nr:NAD-dependent epimerase/dehydratase family protein [Candidatus Nanopelagicales bacterium]